MLLKAGKFQSYSFYRFSVIKRNQHEVKLPTTQILGLIFKKKRGGGGVGVGGGRVGGWEGWGGWGDAGVGGWGALILSKV